MFERYGAHRFGDRPAHIERRVIDDQRAGDEGRLFSFAFWGSWAELFLKRKLSFPVSRMWQ